MNNLFAVAKRKIKSIDPRKITFLTYIFKTVTYIKW